MATAKTKTSDHTTALTSRSSGIPQLSHHGCVRIRTSSLEVSALARSCTGACAGLLCWSPHKWTCFDHVLFFCETTTGGKTTRGPTLSMVAQTGY